jgi:ferritin-like metal-binding protein YciE
MNLESLTDLLLHEISDLRDAEEQLLEALPKMAEAASASELQEAFTLHVEETRQQLARLDEIFSFLKTKPEGKRCKAMQGIIAEAQDLLKEQSSADPDVMDAALIAAAQRVEHYEMAGYGCAATYARTLGATKLERLLRETLREEEATDRKLTDLAESMINLDAAENDAEMFKEAGSAK